MTLARLVKRNILVYARNRANVFFSLLSMLIIIGLMAIFLGDMNADNVVDLLKEYGGIRDTAQDRANAEQLVLLWTLAGILVVNSITITMTMVGFMVEDEDRHRLPGFYVSPVNRTVFVMGYILAAIIMGFIICLLTLAVGEFYVWLTGGILMTIAELGHILLLILLNVFMSASVIFFIANFVHSTSAFSGLSTIVGTLVGFLSAIYLPMGMLPANIQNVLKCLPLLHGCSLIRDAFTKEVLFTTFSNCPKQLIDGYKEYMGITISWGKLTVSSQFKVMFLLISGIIFIIVSALIQRKRNTVVR